MTFNTEAEFEKALIDLLLSTKGWEQKVLKNPTEQDLIDNWAQILFDNNRHIDRLGDYPLTPSEMEQILEQINALKTPLKLNGFINGKTVSITRDHPDDLAHLGKEVSLKIYDRQEIAAGQSRYQIVQQPKFNSKSKIQHDRRGDVLLLINGMPVIHIELKKSGIPVSQACNQIEKYTKEGIFTGLFSLVQIFVAMEPNETVYFANPSTDGKFNPDFHFHWANVDNEPINQWDKVVAHLLSIPMAHQLIGFYTVADSTDGVLKVMRSYQYYAANAISDKVSKTNWNTKHLLGGFIWHTTGSGKTMTSFKSAQLIAQSKDADKVVFLIDRVELGTQSLLEYRGFANDNESVQATENTGVLVKKLKSNDPADTLIVTSIQKMSNINAEDEGLKAKDLEAMRCKRIVFIVDEAHRSTFGDMLRVIKNTFDYAMFFGFTGTPIHDENQKKFSKTSTIFGDELHRYSIADGIRDKNVLGFDPYKVLTYKDKDLRKAVALEKAKATDESDVFSDEKKKEIFNHYMNDVKMAGYKDASGSDIKGIEDELPASQYDREEHREKVIEDIVQNWLTLSQNGKFHAIFATSNIPEAITYYRLLKQKKPDLKITALFDSSENNNGLPYKEDGLVEIIEDYNQRYGQQFTLATHDKFKKDIAKRLAHKENYAKIATTPEIQLDLLIVVDQMLTGFDSKWINTLYLDKVLKYENVIQAFSRTNRLFGHDKPFGTIRYYRKPHTMERNINDAIKLYSGDKPFSLFVDLLDSNLNKMNALFTEIAELFTNAGLQNFEQLPNDLSERGKFVKLFKAFNNHLEAAKVQGFKWSQLSYCFEKEDRNTVIDVVLDENDYLVLAVRYKELFSSKGGSGGSGEIPFDIVGYLTEIDTGRIDADYMNSRFEKYLRTLSLEGADVLQLQQCLDELHKSFASLTQEEQKFASIFLRDVQSGNLVPETDKTFRDYIYWYQSNAQNDRIRKVSQTLGLDEAMLRGMINTGVTEHNINEYGRFDALKATADKVKAKNYFEQLENTTIASFKINIKVHNWLQRFILSGGQDEADTQA